MNVILGSLALCVAFANTMAYSETWWKHYNDKYKNFIDLENDDWTFYEQKLLTLDLNWRMSQHYNRKNLGFTT